MAAGAGTERENEFHMRDWIKFNRKLNAFNNLPGRAEQAWTPHGANPDHPKDVSALSLGSARGEQLRVRAGGPLPTTQDPTILSSLFSSPSFWYLIILWQALSSKLAPSCRKSRPTQLTSLIKDALINSSCSAGGTSPPHRRVCVYQSTHAYTKCRAVFQTIWSIRFSITSLLFKKLEAKSRIFLYIEKQEVFLQNSTISHFIIEEYIR